MAPKNKNLWHPIWFKCDESWKENFSSTEYEYIMWDDAKIDEFIEDKFPQYVTFYYSLPFHIMQLDFARYCILYEYGGIYADMDYLCMRNFYDELRKKTIFVEGLSSEETIQNSLIIAEKKNKHIFNLINECKNKFYYYEIVKNIENSLYNNYVLMICGPGLISNYYNQLSKEDQEHIQILDKNLYNPDILSDNFDLNKVNTLHLLTGKWGKESIRHKSQFAGVHNISLLEYYLKEYQSFRSEYYQKFSHLFEQWKTLLK